MTVSEVRVVDNGIDTIVIQSVEQEPTELTGERVSVVRSIKYRLDQHGPIADATPRLAARIDGLNAAMEYARSVGAPISCGWVDARSAA